VVFIGTWANDKRTTFLERLLADGVALTVYGNSWEKLPTSSPLREGDVVRFRPVYGSDMSQILNGSKIALAFLRAHNRDQQTARTYEIPACGAFMLHERTSEAVSLFKEGSEAEFFDSYDEMRDKIRYYLSNSSAREAIARNGYLRATQFDMSYDARVQTVFDTYRGGAGGEP
jgi:spore maturation protein CgeB